MPEPKEIFDKAVDLLMFREGKDDADGSLQPVVTTGSVVWGILLRSAIIFILTFFLIDVINLREYWWVVAFILWLGAAYPGWRQYQKFQERIKIFQEETLCGQCRHFDVTSQLCKIFDEHPTKDYVPCEGLSWEPIEIQQDE
ncbi:MAG: hypothetical protein WCT77_10590 [Bacteroidota bacterium]|jgi:hypothetical protein